jgi:hypothetical protein
MKCLQVFFGAVTSFLIALPGLASEKQIKLIGSTASFKLSDLRPGEVVTVYGVSKGNSSNPVKINLYGPKGVRVSASAAKVTGTIEATLRAKRAFYPIEMTEKAALDARDAECVDFSPGDAASEEEPPFDPNSIVSTSDPICNEYTPSDIAALGEGLAETYGGSWDAGRVCGYIVYVYRGGAGEGELIVPLPTPTPVVTPLPMQGRKRVPKVGGSEEVISNEYGAVLSKNACGKESDRYIFRVRVILPKVLPSSGFLRVRLFETKHFGGKEATIKPVSDGMYAPQPLLLMNYLGFCGQKISVVKWNKNKPVGKSATKVFDLIRYRDLVLTRTPISSLLTGGEASVELFTQNGGYGACFELTRTRQRVNGYPG